MGDKQTCPTFTAEDMLSLLSCTLASKAVPYTHILEEVSETKGQAMLRLTGHAETQATRGELPTNTRCHMSLEDTFKHW